MLIEGGEPGHCGWLKDKYGLSWQVVPKILYEMLQDPDPARVTRVTEALYQMTKIDIAKLQQAYEQA
jgi:predicted 3-demethylubiquinone-9 3-methyltransferase (glyoxalase superfamily)